MVNLIVEKATCSSKPSKHEGKDDFVTLLQLDTSVFEKKSFGKFSKCFSCFFTFFFPHLFRLQMYTYMYAPAKLQLTFQEFFRVFINLKQT